MIENDQNLPVTRSLNSIVRAHILLIAVCLIVAQSSIAGRLLDQSFTDPAPPKLVPHPQISPPDPKAQEGLKFHAVPKPLADGARTHDWRSFLGPGHNGVLTESPLLANFGKGPALVWETPKGEGYSTPAVIGDRVILFHRVGDEEIVDCLQAETGKRYWRVAYPTDYRDQYGWSGGPRCQPVSDGESVFTYGAEGKLQCVKLTTGMVVWKRDILKEFKVSQNFFGVGSTPLIEGENLIVNVGAPDGPCVAAFDKKTGKMTWGAGKEWTAGYASPIPADIHGKRRILVFTGGESHPSAGGLLCIDPVNGHVDFRFPWRSRSRESVNASAPLAIGNQVFISECYGVGAALLDFQPDLTAKPAWTNTSLGTHFMTAIHKDGYLYGIDGHGPQNAPLVCIELKTGKEMWRSEPEWEETIPTPQGNRKVKISPGLASLMLVDGRGLMLTEYGHLVWLDLNPAEYKEVDRARLFLARETWGTPALSKGLLYVCQNERGVDDSERRLLCYDLRGGKGAK